MKSTLIEAYDMTWFLGATIWTIEMLNLDSIWRNYEFLKKKSKILKCTKQFQCKLDLTFKNVKK